MLLSVVPGLGHWYSGRRGRGVVWFFGVLFCYSAGYPVGLIMHVICAGNAGWSANRTKRLSRRANRWRIGTQQF
jgi:hypothetical protein